MPGLPTIAAQRTKSTLLAFGAGLILVCIGAAAAGSLLFQLQGLTISSYSVAANGVSVGTAAFSQGATTVEPVALTSSNPGVASVPPSVPVIPPNDRVTFPVRGVMAGCTTIIVAHRGRSREKQIVVHPVNGAAAFSLTVPEQIVPLNGRLPGRVTTGTFGTAVVALSSNNPTVASVPSSVETERGTVSFRISGLHAGCAIISATVSGHTLRKTVQVVAIDG